MKEFVSRLSSRKFLLALAAAIAAAAAGEWGAAAAAVVAYLAAEGVVDYETVRRAGQVNERVGDAIDLVGEMIPMAEDEEYEDDEDAPVLARHARQIGFRGPPAPRA